MSADNLEKIHAFLKKANEIAWGPPLLFLLLGTGIFLMIQLRALPVRRLVFALRTAFGRRARRTGEPTEAGVSPFASLMTELAAEIGTGNIVGVASAMALGGPGALVWMMLAAVIGLALKFSESFLSVKYRMQKKDGTYCGGPMVTLTRAFPEEKLAKVLAVFFSGSAVLVSLGMGNMTQANSIALAMQDTFGVIMLALVNNQPKVLNLLDMLNYYLMHQKEVVTRRTKYDLNKAEERAHLLEGLLIALDHIDEVISIIRGSKPRRWNRSWGRNPP